MSAIPKRIPQAVGHGIELVGLGRRLSIAEVEILHSLHRNNMEMHMGDLETGDHQTDPLTLDNRPLGLPNVAGHPIEMGRRFFVKVEPVIDLLPGNHQYMAGMQGPNVEHADARVVGPHQPTWDFSCDDSGENRRHGPDGK